MNKLHLSSSQKKTNLWIGGLTTLGLLIVAIVLGQAAANEETGSNLMLVVIGLTLGVLVRSSTKRGWKYAMAQAGLPAPFLWTAKRRLGVAWRALAALVAGGLIISGLSGLASGDLSLGLFMAVAVLLITAGGILVGLTYGWNEAQTNAQTLKQTSESP
jgi:hypothetical protein